MRKENQSIVTEFIFLGFQKFQSLNPMLFVLILIIHFLTLVGNMIIIILVAMAPSLKSPMYFFLAQLSLSDIMLNLSVVPKLLQIILNGGSTISVTGCITQFYFCGASGVGESLLLTVMSYDRYLAICKPLHYTSIMDFRFCTYIALFCWVFTCVLMLFITILMCNLRFCDHHTIDHYFCDLGNILELSCSDHSVLDHLCVTTDIIFANIPFILILFSYISIFINIYHIPSTSGKQKAFSTCSSHLTVVSTYYGSLITIYVVPSKGQSRNVNKFISLLYTQGTPFFNPLIYSLRNHEIKSAVKYIYKVAKGF